MGWLLHWLAVHTGTVNETGPFYGFYSGFGSILLPPLITLAGIAAVFWWHHQCHARGCYWYARRTTAAGDPLCWRHHPHPQRTVEELHLAHREAAVTKERGD
jgi:hypothetical protein